LQGVRVGAAARGTADGAYAGVAAGPAGERIVSNTIRGIAASPTPDNGF
jgi:hypothetical protein